MLLTEPELNLVVQSMCHDGHYDGAAVLIETWVMEELEADIAVREAEKGLTELRYENITPIEEEVKRELPFFEQLAEVRTIVDKANEQVDSVADRMNAEFGEDGWGA